MIITVPPSYQLVHLWGVRYRAEILVNEGEEALRSVLETDNDGADDSVVRPKLASAVRIAKELVAFLDKRFDFDGETATPKEESCV